MGFSDKSWSCRSYPKPNNSSILYTIRQADKEILDSHSPIDISTHPSILDIVSDISMASKSSISTDFDDITFGSSVTYQDIQRDQRPS